MVNLFPQAGGYGSPYGSSDLRRRGIFQDPGESDPRVSLGNDASLSMLNSGGDGSAGNPIVAGGDPSAHFSQMTQPKNKWQSFLGGARGGGLMGGLSTLAGSGGIGGAIGGAARFLL